MANPSFISETQILIKIARNPKRRFKWTNHGRKSLIDDGRITKDIEDGLTNCRVIFVEWKKDALWHAVGQDLDGKEFTAVVVVYEEEILIKIVTTF